MTTLQLKVAIYIKKYGSISNASKELNISQPNASNYLKTLEEEIGFPIFSRGKNGTVVTEKGNIFLKHAIKILEEQEEILSIKEHEDIYKLRIGSVNYYNAIEPFIKICEQHKDDKEAVFEYVSVTAEQGIKELYNNELDVVFAPLMKHQITGVSNACLKANISMVYICTMPTVINVRKDHPAIKEGKVFNITQGSDAMKDYPYVTYKKQLDDSASTSYNDSDFVKCSYKMLVDEVDVRVRMVASTNAFSFTLMPSRILKDRYNIVSFPVPGVTLDLYCLVCEGNENKKEIQEYISLLKEELKLNNSIIEK